MSTVLTKTFSEPALCRKEILRYMGCKSSSDEAEGLIDRAWEMCRGKLTYNTCYIELPLTSEGNSIRLGNVSFASRDLSKALNGCSSAIIFAATVGLELDRLMLRYSRLSTSVAVCLQAIGAERIEALCDTLCGDLKEKYAKEGKILRPRFSPGYGDLPLEIQMDIFTVLDCERKIGLTLNQSLLMSPTKSVTAIVGIKQNGKENENT